MRMTRDAYAREVRKAVEALSQGQEGISCPHENCEQSLRVLPPNIRTGTTVLCPEHGVIFRE